MNRKESATSAKKCLALLHEEQCLELRIKGLPYREIGKKVGISHEGVSKALKRALEKHKKVCSEKVDEHIALELERLDQILRAMLPKATNEDKPDKRAAEIVLKAMERRADLLGLDAPKKKSIDHNPEGKPVRVEHGLPDDTVDEIKKKILGLPTK